MAKKYNKIWELVKETCKGSPKEYKEKYYSSMLTSLRRWVKENNLDKKELIDMIVENVGKKCRYCGVKMSVKKGNKKISLDHSTPKARGGQTTKENINFICSRCNKRKNILTDEEYKQLLDFLDTFDKKARDYVLKQLTMSIF